ncbi:MAG: imidazolonepropionase [Geminicoccaceae bacterium]
MVKGAGPYGAVPDGALVVEDGGIAWVGPERDLPDWYRQSPREDLGGNWLTPGLIDCHTHLVHAGERAHEFEMRLHGASYDDIIAAGGGVLATVAATRDASEDALVESALSRLDRLMAEGVTTIEIKSGYGLDTESELKMLRAARRLAIERDVRVRTTFFGAHALPNEYQGNASGYLQRVARDMLPEVLAHQLADQLDIACERTAFTPAQVSPILEAGRLRGLPLHVHCEHGGDTEGARLAASYGALSCGHIDEIDSSGIEALAESGTVAVLTPGATYSLNAAVKPPIAALRAAGVTMAVASDCNPGTSPTTSLLLMLNMACTLFRLEPEEALAGVTRNAAQALGLQTEIGTLEVGKRADLCLWDVLHPSELAYRLGANPLRKVMREGQWRN